MPCSLSHTSLTGSSEHESGCCVCAVCINKNLSIHLFLKIGCERDKAKQQILCASGLVDSFHSVQDFFEQSIRKIKLMRKKPVEESQKKEVVFKSSGTQPL